MTWNGQSYARASLGTIWNTPCALHMPTMSSCTPHLRLQVLVMESCNPASMEVSRMADSISRTRSIEYSMAKRRHAEVAGLSETACEAGKRSSTMRLATLVASKDPKNSSLQRSEGEDWPSGDLAGWRREDGLMCDRAEPRARDRMLPTRSPARPRTRSSETSELILAEDWPIQRERAAALFGTTPHESDMDISGQSQEGFQARSSTDSVRAAWEWLAGSYTHPAGPSAEQASCGTTQSPSVPRGQPQRQSTPKPPMGYEAYPSTGIGGRGPRPSMTSPSGSLNSRCLRAGLAAAWPLHAREGLGTWRIAWCQKRGLLS